MLFGVFNYKKTFSAILVGKKRVVFNGFHNCISPELDRKHLERLGFGEVDEIG